MNKLNEGQQETIVGIIDAVNAIENADILDGIRSVVQRLRLATDKFRESLPFDISDDQLLAPWYVVPEGLDGWKPQTILENEIFVFLRNLASLSENSGIYDFSGALQNVTLCIDEVLEASNAEYHDDTPQFNGRAVSY